MSLPGAPGDDETALRQLDAAALARWRRRQAMAGEPPWLHQEVARRLAERLALPRQQPGTVIDWKGDGAAAGLLHKAYPGARVVAFAPVRQPAAARRWWQAWSRPPASAARGAAPDGPPADGQAGLVWSCMALHWARDPLAEFRRWQAALAVDGFVMFATFGPGTLDGLRRLYARAGWPAPMAPLVDMHDLGDMLLQAGFSDPVMDQETLSLQWPDAAAMLHELRGLGANLHPGRFAGLRTPRWRAELEQRLAREALGDGKVTLGFEIVYGHAFKPLPRPRAGASTEISLQDMRSILGARRKS